MTTKKIIIVSHRGTKAHQAEVGEQNWAGDSYRKVEQDSLKKVPKKHSHASRSRSQNHNCR